MELIRKVVQKILRDYGDNSMQEKLRMQGSTIVELQRQIRNLKNEKIKVVFVCHRAAIWNSLRTVFESCNQDEAFDVTIVTIPNKKQLPKLGLNHEEYVSEGAEKFFENYPCRVIQGYDYEKHAWYDLRSLQPDYVFFQTPYDICRPPEYKSDVVSLYTKLSYVHYGMPFMGGMIAEESFPKTFLENVYFHFAEFPEMQKYYVERVPENAVHSHCNICLTGYPKLDGVERYRSAESSSWINPREKGLFRVMWTPRWSMNEGNCTFFDYKDKLPQYVQENKEMELLFRPHPQAFAEFIEKGQMTKQQVDEYKALYEKSDIMSIDAQQDYLPSFYSSDVLITDESSIMPEYFLTEKPVIFTYKEIHLNEFAEKLSKGFYWAKDWEELEKHLIMLKNGEDPLAEKRRELIKTEFCIPENGAGYEIKEILKRDFFGGRSQNISR